MSTVNIWSVDHHSKQYLCYVFCYNSKEHSFMLRNRIPAGHSHMPQWCCCYLPHLLLPVSGCHANPLQLRPGLDTASSLVTVVTRGYLKCSLCLYLYPILMAPTSNFLIPKPCSWYSTALVTPCYFSFWVPHRTMSLDCMLLPYHQMSASGVHQCSVVPASLRERESITCNREERRKQVRAVWIYYGQHLCLILSGLFAKHPCTGTHSIPAHLLLKNTPLSLPPSLSPRTHTQ